MGFNTVVSGGQQTIIDAGGYSGRDYLCLCPLVVVFRARPAVVSAQDVIFSIDYNTVTVGAYTDIREDMVVLVTSGTALNDLKRPLYRGRVSKLPTSTTLFIGEASIALDPALYITVIEQRDVAQYLRSGNLIDGHLAFQKLRPAIKGLQSSYFKEPTAGAASFPFAPTAQPMEDGVTISSWLWEIPGATYTVGTSTSQNPTVSLPTGHVWATVKATDSNGVVGSFTFEIYVQDRYASAMIFLGSEGADITNDWDNGVNASVNYFDGVQDILDRTRCTIVTFEQGRNGDAGFPNISFVGYLRQDDNETRGDDTYSTLKSRQYQISGFAALAGEVKLSQLAVTHKTTPTLWDEMKYPNAARVIAHLTSRYSNLARLCCIDYGTLNSNDWYGGNMDIESPFLLDACNQTAEEINAQLIFTADGQIGLHRNLNFLDDTARNAAAVVATIPTSRMTVLNYSHPHMPNLAQLQVGFRSYRTADGSSIGLTATAPAVALNEGADFDEAPNQLLTANASLGDARIEAGDRAANLLAYRDDGDEWTFELDGWYRFIQPGQHQWWKTPVAASEISNGLGLSSSDRLLLKSISHKFNPERGTRQCKATFKRETVGGLAMILVEVIPDVVPTVMQPRPPMSAYQGAFAPSGTLNYTSDDPARLPPSGYASVTMPYSPAEQAAAEDAQDTLHCRVQRPPINFRNSADVTTPFSLLNGVDYLIGVKGFAQIAGDAWHQHRNLVTSQDSFSIDPLFGAWALGVGFTPTDGEVTPGVFIRSLVVSRAITSTTLTRIRITFDLTKGSYSAVTPVAIIFINGSPVASVNPADITDGANKTLEWSGSSAAATFISVQIVTSYQGSAVYSGAATLTSMTVDGVGTDGFTGLPGVAIHGDAFYQWYEDDEEIQAELYPATRGLRLNSTAVSVPPDFNPNHEYIIAYTGDGNPLPMRYEHEDHTQVENALLKAIICRVVS